MIISSIEELLTNERTMRFGRTRNTRISAGAAVIEAASHHPDPKLPKYAAGHLRSRGVTVLYDTEMSS
jgi:hypothetical protein